MAYMEIFKVSALVLQAGYSHMETNSNSLKVGKGYFTYIQFDLSELNQINFNKLSGITRAQLTLFKISNQQVRRRQMEWNYKVVPLLDYGTIQSNNYICPSIDEECAIFFKDYTCMNYIEIDLTNLINKWLTGNLENRGMFIAGRYGSNLLKFVSSQDEMKALRPFLSINYEEELPEIRPRIISLPNEVTILNHND